MAPGDIDAEFCAEFVRNINDSEVIRLGVGAWRGEVLSVRK